MVVREGLKLVVVVVTMATACHFAISVAMSIVRASTIKTILMVLSVIRNETLIIPLKDSRDYR